MGLVCNRSLQDHCCYLKGITCKFLRENTSSGNTCRWTCTLRERYGNWEDVHNSPEYLATVKPVWTELNIKDCGEYTCENCIEDGNT